MSATPAPIVFFDIAATELAGQAAFYRDVFHWSIDPSGRLSVPVTAPLEGALRVEQPQAEPVAERVLYVGVPDVSAKLAEIVAHGGSVIFPRSEFKGVAVIALFKDPAGNRMGLVEMDADKPKIP
jgi:predicted enzyme related to lactoylglutathione lyase